MGGVVFAFTGLIIVLPVLIFFVRRYPIFSEMRDVLDEPFACPNCGHRFKVKMRQAWYRLPSYYLANGFRVKCPKCKKKDVCTHSHHN